MVEKKFRLHRALVLVLIVVDIGTSVLGVVWNSVPGASPSTERLYALHFVSEYEHRKPCFSFRMWFRIWGFHWLSFVVVHSFIACWLGVQHHLDFISRTTTSTISEYAVDGCRPHLRSSCHHLDAHVTHSVWCTQICSEVTCMTCE